ncbi:hypothetical protein B0I35DRAFT_63333 [Stachybotrys elegans]|uniref:Uncharacterized protein n=1 Tax=Stachybotrys elegans TaxID=80388 RepID=A0A8K0WP07_9HYPO|nr:hypothetical protein B0I35DRAFT_63333 [Stachybotrys elegans]
MRRGRSIGNNALTLLPPHMQAYIQVSGVKPEVSGVAWHFSSFLFLLLFVPIDTERRSGRSNPAGHTLSAHQLQPPGTYTAKVSRQSSEAEKMLDMGTLHLSAAVLGTFGRWAQLDAGQRHCAGAQTSLPLSASLERSCGGYLIMWLKSFESRVAKVPEQTALISCEMTSDPVCGGLGYSIGVAACQILSHTWNAEITCMRRSPIGKTFVLYGCSVVCLT